MYIESTEMSVKMMVYYLNFIHSTGKLRLIYPLLLYFQQFEINSSRLQYDKDKALKLRFWTEFAQLS